MSKETKTPIFLHRVENLWKKGTDGEIEISAQPWENGLPDGVSKPPLLMQNLVGICTLLPLFLPCQDWKMVRSPLNELNIWVCTSRIIPGCINLCGGFSFSWENVTETNEPEQADMLSTDVEHLFCILQTQRQTVGILTSLPLQNKDIAGWAGNKNA